MLPKIKLRYELYNFVNWLLL